MQIREEGNIDLVGYRDAKKSFVAQREILHFLNIIIYGKSNKISWFHYEPY